MKSEGLLSRLNRAVKTVALSVGGVVMVPGSMMFAIGEFFVNMNVKSDVASVGSRIVALTSALFVNGMTRGFSVWKTLFRNNNTGNSDDLLTEIGNGLSNRGALTKLIMSGVTITGLVTGALSIATQTFFGSHSLFKFMGITDPTWLYLLDGYMTVSALVVFITFSAKIAFKNLVYVADNAGVPSNKTAAAREVLLSTARIIGQTTITNYLAQNSLRSFIPSSVMSRSAINVASGTIAVGAVSLFSWSRAIQGYKKSVGQQQSHDHDVIASEGDSLEVHVSEVESVASEDNIEMSTKLKMSLRAISLVYAIFFGMTSYISLVNAESELNLGVSSSSLEMIALNILLSLGTAAVEYYFMESKVESNVEELIQSNAGFFNRQVDEESQPLRPGYRVDVRTPSSYGSTDEPPGSVISY